MFIWKESSIIQCDAFSNYQKIAEKYDQNNMVHSELENIYPILIDKLMSSININDPSSILENLQIFNEFVKSHQSIIEFPSVFLLEILNLLSYPDFEIQKLSSDCIVQLIVNNNFTGFFYIDNNIIEIIQKEAESQNDLLFYFFPIIRILSSLNSSVFQHILKIIPLSLLDYCFEKKELIIETSLFLFTISYYNQDESMQSFILNKIRTLFELESNAYLKYLAYVLHQLSNSPTFSFDLFQSLNLHEFVNFSIKNPKYHCVEPICNFLSNLFKNRFITSISKQNLKQIIIYSWSYERPKRCEASIELLIKILEFGDMTNKTILLKIFPIGKTFIEILRDMQPSFSIKCKITQFLLTFASKISFEDFSQLIAFGFFDVIDFIITFSDDFLLEKCSKLILDSFQFFVAAGTTDFFISKLKTVDFDSISSEQIDENESLGSFLALLHKIIEDKSI